jgi:hypothetical protein
VAKSHLRTVAIVLGVFAVLMVLAWFGYRQREADLPDGSSRSTAPTGTRALFLWYEALGAQPQRLDGLQTGVPGVRGQRDVLFVVQPLLPLLPPAQQVLDEVAERGGTLVLAGDTLMLDAYTSGRGLHLSISETRHVAASSPEGDLRVPVETRLRIQVDRNTLDRATPLLIAPNGEWIAARIPYRNGALVVFASALPLTNRGLRDPDSARLVYQHLVAPVPSGAVVAFDESHRLPGTPVDSEASLTRGVAGWVLSTPLGGVVAYTGTVLFLYLLLSGRHLGPPLRPVEAGRTSRTMYEHVQALAGLYRRSGQLAYLRQHYAQHYRRLIARAFGADAVFAGSLDPAGAANSATRAPLSAADLVRHGVPAERAARLSQALAGIEGARSERQLVGAIAEAEGVFMDLPRARWDTLST